VQRNSKKGYKKLFIPKNTLKIPMIKMSITNQGLIEDWPEIMKPFSPRDQFALMLLERIEAMEDRFIELSESCKLQHEKTKRIYINMLFQEYKRCNSNSIDEPKYYMRVLNESILMWRDGKPLEVKSKEECVNYVMSFRNPISIEIESEANQLGLLLLNMSVDDLEEFMRWDQMPDLIDVLE
jgi:hypothetical protein